MPLYEYECEACGARFEQIQKFSDPPIDVCPNCGERKVHKLLSSPAIQFKGSGWYITDYARKGGRRLTRGRKSRRSLGSRQSQGVQGVGGVRQVQRVRGHWQVQGVRQVGRIEVHSATPATSSKDS